MEKSQGRGGKNSVWVHTVAIDSQKRKTTDPLSGKEPRKYREREVGKSRERETRGEGQGGALETYHDLFHVFILQT